jgi:hypothetical protein
MYLLEILRNLKSYCVNERNLFHNNAEYFLSASPFIIQTKLGMYNIKLNRHLQLVFNVSIHQNMYRLA